MMKITKSVIAAWRTEIGWITLGEAIMLLKHIGDFERDKVIIREKGYARYQVWELPFNRNEYCVNIRPVYFEGGPIGSRRFKGTLLTLVLDRVLLTAYEKGGAYALRMVKYARGCFRKEINKANIPSGVVYSI
jgi:hypothetical protein